MFPPMLGAKINLRPLRSSDAESICRYANNRAISRFTFIRHPNLIEHTRRFLAYSRALSRKKTGRHFGIEDKATGEIIGVVGLEGIDRHNKKAEIGYWLARQFWHQGIAQEAVWMVLLHCFHDLKLKRVYAHVFPGNVASERLLLRLGFTLEGIERASRWRRGRWLDCFLYSILREEFKSRRRKSNEPAS